MLTVQDGNEELARLLELAKQAPPPRRSRLTPYLGVLLELRGKGYSYEKIADFLNENTSQNFSRSQVFAFLQRNSTIFGVSEQKIADEEGEPLPSQLIWDHARGLSEALPKGIEVIVTVIPAAAVGDANRIPSPIGSVGDKFYVCYRIRNEGGVLEAEWCAGEKWRTVSSDDIRHIEEEVARIFPERKDGV